jgi:hypothetical protein
MTAMLLLAGTNPALLEGLTQTLAGTGTRVVVATTLSDAEDLRAQYQPVLLVVERAMLAGVPPGHPFVGSVLGAACALVTYRESGPPSGSLAPGLVRLVLADLELPLERNRLLALAEHAVQRARAVGRPRDVTRPDRPAS